MGVINKRYVRVALFLFMLWLWFYLATEMARFVS